MSAVPVFLTVKGPWNLDAGCVVLFAFWHVIADENKEKTNASIDNKTDINCNADCICIDGAADYQGGYRYDPQNKTLVLSESVLFYIFSTSEVPPLSSEIQSMISSRTEVLSS